MTYDPRKQLGAEPEPDLAEHGRAIWAMVRFGGAIIICTVIWSAFG